VRNNGTWRTQLEDLAERNLLRAYWLGSHQRAYAYEIGFRHENVYHFEQTAFDTAMARYSPGKVLLYLIIQDLIARTKVRLVSFGPGASAYKQDAGNFGFETASVVLFRKTLRNRVRKAAYVNYERLLRLPKTLASALRRKG